MRRFASSFLIWALGCATPAPPPPVVIAPPHAQSAPPSAEPERALASVPEDPPAPPLPLHRFAALVPGQAATLFAVQGRLLLRAGRRIYSLSAGRMDREPLLEKAFDDARGAIGGRYPDALVADRQVKETGKSWTTARQYVRISGGKVTVIGKARQDAGSTISNPAQEVVALPDGRVLAWVDFEGGEGGSALGFLDFSPASKGDVEAGLSGIAYANYRKPRLLLRSDGSVVTAWSPQDQPLTLWRWAKGAAAPSPTPIPEVGDGVIDLFESTRGELFVLTQKGLHRQAGASFQREAPGVPVLGAWPLPDGGALLLTEHLGAMVRDDKGRFSRASWPVVTIEGRKLPAILTDARCTREAGFWAVAADGLGLFHDRAPREIVDLSRPEPGEKGAK